MDTPNRGEVSVFIVYEGPANRSGRLSLEGRLVALSFGALIRNSLEDDEVIVRAVSREAMNAEMTNTFAQIGMSDTKLMREKSKHLGHLLLRCQDIDNTTYTAILEECDRVHGKITPATLASMLPTQMSDIRRLLREEIRKAAEEIEALAKSTLHQAPPGKRGAALLIAHPMSYIEASIRYLRNERDDDLIFSLAQDLLKPLRVWKLVFNKDATGTLVLTNAGIIKFPALTLLPGEE